MMNKGIKSSLKYAGVFLLGLLVGAFLLETLEMYLRPSYRDLIIRTHLKTEQEFLASRAVRDNRLLDATFHRWAVVNTESDDGFRILRNKDSGIDDAYYLYPVHMLILKWMSAGDNIKRGSMIAEGYDRGKLAVALESLGQKKDAEKQWDRAQELIHRKTIKETKEAVYSILEQEKTDIHLRAEDKILGPQKK
jgi:hypothetical protein